jgi:hypothetical protein
LRSIFVITIGYKVNPNLISSFAAGSFLPGGKICPFAVVKSSRRDCLAVMPPI